MLSISGNLYKCTITVGEASRLINSFIFKFNENSSKKIGTSLGELKSLLAAAVIDDRAKNLSRFNLASNGAQVSCLVNKYLLCFSAVVVSQNWKMNTCESGEFGAVLMFLVFFTSEMSLSAKGTSAVVSRCRSNLRVF